MGRLSDQIEQDPSQGGTYVQRAIAIRRREYPGEESCNEDYRRPYQGQRPLIEEDTLVEDPPIEMEDPLVEDTLMEVGDPLVEEDTLVEDLLMEEDLMDPPEDKDHQTLKDILGL